MLREFREMYSDTLDMDFSFDVPVHRPALLSRKMFDVPVRPMDAKGLSYRSLSIFLFLFFCKRLTFFPRTMEISQKVSKT